MEGLPRMPLLLPYSIRCIVHAARGPNEGFAIIERMITNTFELN